MIFNLSSLLYDLNVKFDFRMCRRTFPAKDRSSTRDPYPRFRHHRRPCVRPLPRHQVGDVCARPRCQGRCGSQDHDGPESHRETPLRPGKEAQGSRPQESRRIHGRGPLHSVRGGAEGLGEIRPEAGIRWMSIRRYRGCSVRDEWDSTLRHLSCPGLPA